MSLTVVCLPSTYLTTLMQDHYVCTGNMFLECVVDGVRQKHGLIRYLANSS